MPCEELTPALGREEVLAEYHNVIVVLMKDVKLPMQGAQSSPRKVPGDGYVTELK